MDLERCLLTRIGWAHVRPHAGCLREHVPPPSVRAWDDTRADPLQDMRDFLARVRASRWPPQYWQPALTANGSGKEIPRTGEP